MGEEILTTFTGRYLLFGDDTYFFPGYSYFFQAITSALTVITFSALEIVIFYQS
jgi:hypothetical protein